MIFKSLFVLTGVLTLSSYILDFLFVFAAFFLSSSRLSLAVLKISLMLMLVSKVILLSFLGTSFPVFRPLIFFVLLILCFAPELRSHLKKRTTAAYSTSDSQAQRFFNVRLALILILLVLLSLLIPAHGGGLASRFMEASAGPIFMIFLLVGSVLFIRDLILVSQNARMLSYVLKSHARSFFQGKMKRFW